MKRIKFMLSSLALVAVLAGALAFKAKYKVNYCTAAIPDILTCTQVACPNLVTSTTVGVPAGTPFVCTTTPVAGTCGGGLLCTTTTTSLKID